MTIDEAIKHCEEVMMENLEKTKDRNASDPIAISCWECADNHRQLAEWLKELKSHRDAWEKIRKGLRDKHRESFFIGVDDAMKIVDKYRPKEGENE